MKNSIIICCLCFIQFGFAQTDVEDRDDSFILDNNKNQLKIDIKQPFLQPKLKKCNQFSEAAFPGGSQAYKELLAKYMYYFLNADYYTLNGDFTFSLTIDQNGKVMEVEGSPKVQNSEVFFSDMQYVIRRIKTNWLPASCNGKPTDSEVKIKMNFSSVSSDL